MDAALTALLDEVAGDLVRGRGAWIFEAGDHEPLMQHGGRYERPFSLQAQGYR